MSFVTPWVLGLGALAAVVVGVLHLLSVRRPPTLLLPTARFVPARDVRAVWRTRQPSDIPLLVLRVMALLCAALAVAGLRCARGSASMGVVVVTDHGVLADSTQLRPLVLPTPSLAAMQLASVPTNRDGASRVGATDIAALFPLAWQAARELLLRESRVDSVELHLFTDRAPNTDDAAWRAWRTTWPGRVSVHVRDSTPVVALRTVQLQRTVSGTSDDAVVSGFRAAGVRVVVGDSASDSVSRDSVSRDSVVRVVWPVDGVPTNWRAIAPTDSLQARDDALVVGGQSIRAAWRLTADRTAGDTIDVRPVAWWSDGRVAAVERGRGASCTKEVAIQASPGSDALLSPAALSFFVDLARPCANAASTSIATPPARYRHVLVDSRPAALASVVQRSLGDANPEAFDWKTPTLLAISLLLLYVESRIRARNVATARAE